jgi:uncharacterized protein (DUF1499 family)
MSKTAIAVSIRNKAESKTWAVLACALLLASCSAGPANLHAGNGGQLAPCDGGPHCVSSLAKAPDRHVDPIAYTGSRAIAQQHLEQVIVGMKGAKIVQQVPDYIHATYTSAMLGFVDDVEFVLPADSHDIQLRSSSRVGYYDFGVNRARVETIRKRFEAPAG